MISFRKCSNLATLADLKAEYRQSLLAPLDGMWDTGIIEPAPHWEILFDDTLAGYFAANDEGKLLQFHVRPGHVQKAHTIFEHTLEKNALKQVTVYTIDALSLSFCLDLQKKIRVHTYLYEELTDVRAEDLCAEDRGPTLRAVTASELERTVTLQQECLKGGENLGEWLRAYSGRLISRGELFVLQRDDAWLGLGECRKSDTQAGIADVGMMVAPDHRRKGWATYILARLRGFSRQWGYRAICSTTVDNAGAQKAIERAGFVSRHRIFDIEL